MEKENIRLWDFMRMLQGEAPLEFYVEIVIRATVLYLVLLIGLRLMGKRVVVRMSRSELAATATLAAAVGAPMQSPDRGLLPAILIAGIVITVHRLIAWYAARNERFECRIMGKMDILMKNSCLDLHRMVQVGISRERLFSELRSNSIRHLGQLERVYMEANGAFTLLNSPRQRPGLSILPSWDKDFLNEQPKAEGRQVCAYCGNDKKKENDHCTNCGREEWVTAIL